MSGWRFCIRKKAKKTGKVYFFVVVVVVVAVVVVVVVVAVVFGEYHRTVFSIFQISTNSFRFNKQLFCSADLIW